MKKSLVLVLAMMMLFGTMAFAETPAEIYADIKGVEVEEVYGMGRGHGGSEGLGAQLEGEELEEFHERLISAKEEWIEGLVEEGRLTEAEGKAYLDEMKANIENCDGTSRQLGQPLKIGGGQGFGAKNGQGRCNGSGASDGSGFGTRGRWQESE